MSQKEKHRDRPGAEEARGRRFMETMRSRHAWRNLTGQQLEQVLDMAEEFHNFMRRKRDERTKNP